MLTKSSIMFIIRDFLNDVSEQITNNFSKVFVDVPFRNFYDNKKFLIKYFLGKNIKIFFKL